MHEEFPMERKEVDDFDGETADETIAHAQELLEDGLYDEEARDEAILMLNKARLLTKNEQAIAQIDVLLEDIETRYGGNE